MPWLLPVGLLVLILAVFVVLRRVAGRLRVQEEACPSCGHPVRGLVEPRCSECGRELLAGVVGTGKIRPWTGLWLGVLTLLLGVIWTAAVPGVIEMRWNAILNWAGLIKNVVEIDTLIKVGIDQSNHLTVRKVADYVKQDWPSVTGEVQVAVLSDGEELAVWKGTGQVLVGRAGGGDILIDGMDAVEYLRLQIPPDSDSPFARILHDPEDASILANTIAIYAAPDGMVSGLVSDSRGKSMFLGGISTTHSGTTGVFWPSPILFAPIYIISGVIFLAYLWLGVRILIDRGRLQPFEPHAEVA